MSPDRGTVRIEADSIIGAPHGEVYRIISDYHEHHPAILPSAFSNLEVERGGVGVGTVIAFDSRLGGRRVRARARIDEPEPGRTLTETLLDSGTVTTFEVVSDGDFSRVSISTDLRLSPGLRGVFERWLAPRMLRKVYAEELANLDRYAREQMRPSTRIAGVRVV